METVKEKVLAKIHLENEQAFERIRFSKFKEDFMERISKVKTFDEWDFRIIKLAFENAGIKQQINSL